MTEQRDLRKDFPTFLDRAYAELKKFQSVADIMSMEVVTTSPDVDMAKAARTMGERHIGSLIIVEKDEPRGIVTERDLLSKILAKGKDPEQVRVGDVMSSPVITIRPTARIKEAAQTMMERKARLVVLRDGRLVGIVTAADLIKSLPESPETELKVDKVMTARITSVEEATPVAEAAKLMGQQRIGSVIVDRNGVHYGIFTERDLLTAFIAAGRSLGTPVGEAASHPLVTIPLGTSIHQTAMMMTQKHIRRLPVEDKNKIVGIVTARDLVEAYAK
jgi:CBS domain-containing protein